jgi:hypothetical protein
MQLFKSESFAEEQSGKMFYVGFFKSPEMWFPLCVLSDPQDQDKLDTLLVASSFPIMDETVKTYAGQISHIEQTFVHYLTIEEIQNLVEMYSLQKIAVVHPDDGLGDGCGCGCACA